MSSTSTQISGVVSTSFSVALKWVLKGKELKDLYSKGGNIRSDVYRLKFLNNLYFFLEMDRGGCFVYDIKVKGSKFWSFKVSYAFLFTKNRAFKMTQSNQLSFLPALQSSFLSSEEVFTIHCLVNACSNVPDSSDKEDDLTLKEGQTTVNLEDIPNITLHGNYKNEMVIDFIRRGEIPVLTVGTAIKIIGETKFHQCEGIKILCSEYLMSNISAQSIKAILKAAVDYDLPHLERECTMEIVNGRLQIK